MASRLVFPTPEHFGLKPGWGHCVVFLGKTLNSRSACFHPGAKMGTEEFNPAMD